MNRPGRFISPSISQKYNNSFMIPGAYYASRKMVSIHRNLNAVAQSMDRDLEGVMPDDWLGHARLKIAQANLSTKQKNFALQLTERLKSQHRTPSEKLAEVAIEKAREKL